MSKNDKVIVLGTESGQTINAGKEETWKIINGIEKENRKNTVKKFVKDNRGMIVGFAAMAAAQTLFNVAKNRIKSR